MSAFAIGVIAATIAAAMMYFTQYFYAETVSAVRFDHVHPYEHNTPSSERHKTIAIWLHALTVLLAAIALIAFIVGMFWSVSLIQTAKLS